MSKSKSNCLTLKMEVFLFPETSLTIDRNGDQKTSRLIRTAMKTLRLANPSFFKVWEGKTCMGKSHIRIVSQRDTKLQMKRSEGRWK